jgi:predicted RNA binding protein YcfA (HicA-like mRNA interferase family)
MPKLPGISHAQAVRVFSKVGFHVAREGKHTIMVKGNVRLTVPRHTQINAFTMGAIAADAGLTPAEFRQLL